MVLDILRGEEKLTLTITRKALPLEAVSGEMLDGIGYIRLDNFYTGTGDDFIRTAESLLEQGASARKLRISPGFLPYPGLAS